MKFTAARIEAGEVIQKEFEVKSSHNKRLKITTIEIIDGKKRFLYFLSEFESDQKEFPGRAFILDKQYGSESYRCLIAQAPNPNRCDCKGFLYRQYCKHVDAIQNLLSPKEKMEEKAKKK